MTRARKHPPADPIRSEELVHLEVTIPGRAAQALMEATGASTPQEAAETVVAILNIPTPAEKPAQARGKR